MNKLPLQIEYNGEYWGTCNVGTDLICTCDRTKDGLIEKVKGVIQEQYGTLPEKVEFEITEI